MPTNQSAPLLNFFASNDLARIENEARNAGTADPYSEYLAANGGGTGDMNDYYRWYLMSQHPGMTLDQIGQLLYPGTGGANNPGAFAYDPATGNVSYRSYDPQGAFGEFMDWAEPLITIAGAAAGGAGLANLAGVGAGAGGTLGAIDAGITGGAGFGAADIAAGLIPETMLPGATAGAAGAGAGMGTNAFDASGWGDALNYTSPPTTPTFPDIPSLPPTPPVPNNGGTQGMTLDPTTGRYVDPYGNVVDMSNMPGTTPGYTTPTGITPGNTSGTVTDWLKSMGFDPANLPPGLKTVVDGIMGNAGTGGYSIPWGDLVGAALEYMNQGNVQDKQLELLQTAIDSDLWRGQQPRYFDPLYNAATQGIGNTDYGRAIAGSVANQDAAKGYNMSGNMLHDIATGLNSGTVNYINALGPLAMGRGGQGSTVAAMTPGIINSINGQNGALGYGLDRLFTGSQPTYAQQSNGTPRNQTLSEFFTGL